MVREKEVTVSIRFPLGDERISFLLPFCFSFFFCSSIQNFYHLVSQESILKRKSLLRDSKKTDPILFSPSPFLFDRAVKTKGKL